MPTNDYYSTDRAKCKQLIKEYIDAYKDQFDGSKYSEFSEKYESYLAQLQPLPGYIPPSITPLNIPEEEPKTVRKLTLIKGGRYHEPKAP